MNKPDPYREALRFKASRVAYDILWRLLYVLVLPLSWIARRFIK